MDLGRRSMEKNMTFKGDVTRQHVHYLFNYFWYICEKSVCDFVIYININSDKLRYL